MSDADAEDVRQLTWLRLVQNVERIRDPERVGDWLATVARRESLKVLSRRKRLVMVGDNETLDGLSGHSESPEQITLRAQRREDAQRAIDTLSEQCRGVLMLTLADPPASYDEISTALAMSVGSVGPVRTRCLRRLRRALAAADAGERLPTAAGHSRCPLVSLHADLSGPEHRKALVGGGPEAGAAQAGQAGQE